MNVIGPESTLEDVAMIVCKALKDSGIDAVLTGGAVVSIYTENQYMSYDLDFISNVGGREIEAAMDKIGFRKTKDRYFEHPETDFFVEFPTPPLAIGNKPVESFEVIESPVGYLKLLTPTHSVMDRLAAWYHWNDPQSLEQALLVAKEREIDMDEIRAWSDAEGMEMKFLHFEERLNLKRGN